MAMNEIREFPGRGLETVRFIVPIDVDVARLSSSEQGLAFEKGEIKD